MGNRAKGILSKDTSNSLVNEGFSKKIDVVGWSRIYSYINQLAPRK